MYLKHVKPNHPAVNLYLDNYFKVNFKRSIRILLQIMFLIGLQIYSHKAL